MKNFLKEFWLWILVPFVLVLGLLALLFVVSGGGDSTSPFVYNVF
jgi:hypothetical protein